MLGVVGEAPGEEEGMRAIGITTAVGARAAHLAVAFRRGFDDLSLLLPWPTGRALFSCSSFDV